MEEIKLIDLLNEVKTKHKQFKTDKIATDDETGSTEWSVTYHDTFKEYIEDLSEMVDRLNRLYKEQNPELRGLEDYVLYLKNIKNKLSRHLTINKPDWKD